MSRRCDMAFPDFWRLKEWQREFAQQVAAGAMPNLTLLRLTHDHFGLFDEAIDGVDTVEIQMADNDYAIGELVHAIATSRFAAVLSSSSLRMMRRMVPTMSMRIAASHSCSGPI